jgi:hypothetical protein
MLLLAGPDRRKKCAGHLTLLCTTVAACYSSGPQKTGESGRDVQFESIRDRNCRSEIQEFTNMAKNTRKVNKANHGTRPASSKARKARRRKLGV